MKEYEQNQQKNKEHYEKVYANYNLNNILYWLNNLEGYLDFVTNYETSWSALYQNDFRNRIKGKKVLEMGCGDCNNAAIMAALGARVYANDIASTSGKIVEQLNGSFDFSHPIVFVEGDFLNNDLASGSFDFVIGKAFLHHLSLPVEREFLKETARLLKTDGEARFFEPAVNSKLLDELRWYIPIGNRPSKFRGEAFRKWKEEDPHPDRSFSSAHFKKAVNEFFEECLIKPVGTLDRFRNLIKNRKWNGRYAKWALKNEQKLPLFLNSKFARSQLIVGKLPLK
ncbi:class I SAM-dependent methyltransferase [Gramella jeungdoensis]|uniref:Class I SAM-dependent methyltransferase n=1 Tax=Gramella jeungdoensis TaxID=708091 RepID=A0ABT0Z0E2_9FLAO|nr:class I SAM-dependent methyltransferase [Gramella jeungdoensis]MCM8569193.1 class I SAM-dependent methyltransferase [Gramella jeungdoensis]